MKISLQTNSLMTQPRTTQPNQPATRSPLTWGLLLAFLIAAAITAYLTFVAVRDTVAAWTATRLEGVPLASSQGNSQSTAALNPQGTPLATLDIHVPLQELGPTPQPWDGASRVTILVMGYDFGDWSDERQCPCRTDTMILLTLDPLTQSAGMLSIPRDLWVNIPGFDYGKINQAYFFGDAAQLPEGGPGLAMRTVEEFLGVPINFYATIDFSAFEKFIDTIGGIEIDVPEEIKVDPVGPGNTVVLQPGKQILNGPVALAYARARYTEGGDIDRAGRQQQVITAIGARILSVDMLPTLISQAPVLYQELASGIKTNLTLDQVIKLSWTAQQVYAKNNIKKGVIGPPDQVILGTSPDGLSILIPVPDKIRELRDEIFTYTGSASPAATADLMTLMKEEAARITVLNGSGTNGLAGLTQDFLKTKEINVIGVGTAEQITSVTTIVDYSGRPYTVRYLLQVMGLPESTPIYNSFDPNSETDIAIIVGEDWAASNPMP